MKCGYSLGVIILAAGESKRMGTPKPLLKLGGRTFLERILACPYLKKSNIHPLIILGHKVKLICENITITYPWEFNKYYTDGRITSIQLGLRMMPETLEGTFIWPVDCPLVPEEVFETLEQQFTGPSSILIPCFNNRRGHPPLIGSTFFPAIQDLKLSQSIRDIYQLNQDKIITVPVSSDTILDNINTPEIFQMVQERYELP